MTHEERLEIARQVADSILRKYSERITAIAVYGSVAKHQDRTYSDLDMWVATTEPIEDVRFFVYKGMAISIAWESEQERLEYARRVTPAWPLQADELRSYIVLFERGDFMQRLREAALDVRETEFAPAIKLLMAHATETINKIRNTRETGDHYRLMVEGRWLALHSAMAVGLLNRRYYPGGRGLYRLARQMPKQPKDYARLLDLAGGFTTAEGDAVYEAAMQLWANMCELVRGEGIEWESSEIPF
jgi:kanamycin nucleotidyltransferase